MESVVIVVTSLANPSRYEVWTVRGHTPQNFVCNAPQAGLELDALITEQESGGQTLITAYVQSQVGA